MVTFIGMLISNQWRRKMSSTGRQSSINRRFKNPWMCTIQSSPTVAARRLHTHFPVLLCLLESEWLNQLTCQSYTSIWKSSLLCRKLIDISLSSFSLHFLCIYASVFVCVCVNTHEEVPNWPEWEFSIGTSWNPIKTERPTRELKSVAKLRITQIGGTYNYYYQHHFDYYILTRVSIDCHMLASLRHLPICANGDRIHGRRFRMSGSRLFDQKTN